MGPLFENSLASRGAQMRKDYGKDFYLDADYDSSNIFVRSIGIQKIIATIKIIIATTQKNYCDYEKKLLRPSKIFASIKSRAVLNTMFLDLIHRQFSVY